jgi:hypothetical protein
VASFLGILTSYLATCSMDLNRTYLRTHMHEYGRVTAHDEVCVIRLGLTFRCYSLTFVANDVHELVDGLHGARFMRKFLCLDGKIHIV